MKASILAAILFGVVILPFGVSAPTEDAAVQERIAEVMQEYPGGTQISRNEVSWDNGNVVLTLRSQDDTVSPTNVGNCETGKFCAYSGTGYTGSSISFSTCTSSHSVAQLGTAVRSIANARTSGQVQAKNGSTVVLTVPHGTGANTTATVTTLACS